MKTFRGKAALAGMVLVTAPAWGLRPDENPPTASKPTQASQPADGEQARLLGNGRSRFDVTGLWLGFEADYQNRHVRSESERRRDSTHENKDYRFTELTGLSLEGCLYDPNLLEYRADLEFGLTQSAWREELDFDHESDRDNGFLSRFDINADILKTKPISMNLYARRGDQRISRRFLPSLREEYTEAGASALAVHGPFTTESGFVYRDVERFGNRLEEDDEELTTHRFWLDHKWLVSDTQKLRLTYEHEREQTEYQGSQYSYDTRRDEVRLEHELLFGPGSKHRLDTYLRYNEEEGELARDEIELVPRLTLQHNDKFRTIHRYGLYRFEQDAIEVTQNKFDTEAIWDPTDKLRFTADAFGMHERVDGDVDTSEFGGGLDAAWHQPTSLGEFFINAATGYQQARSSGDAGRRYVRQEAHQLGGSRPVFLRQRGVVSGSIVAYNANRTRIFVPGIDYIATVISGRACVARILTGRIAQNEAVYFDYAYIVELEATIHTWRNDLLIEHRFEFGLTPYYAYESRCQEVDSSRDLLYPEDNQHRHRFGARYGKDRWEVGSEYEVFDDSVEPFDAWHLTGRAALLQSVAHNLDLSGELSRYWFEGGYDERDVWWLDMDLTDRARITESLWAKAATAYHWEDDSLDGETNGVDLEAGLEFRRGYLTIELTFEYDLLTLPKGDEQGYGMFLNVRRDLSHLLPNGRREP